MACTALGSTPPHSPPAGLTAGRESGPLEGGGGARSLPGPFLPDPALSPRAEKLSPPRRIGVLPRLHVLYTKVLQTHGGVHAADWGRTCMQNGTGSTACGDRALVAGCAGESPPPRSSRPQLCSPFPIWTHPSSPLISDSVGSLVASTSPHPTRACRQNTHTHITCTCIHTGTHRHPHTHIHLRNTHEHIHTNAHTQVSELASGPVHSYLSTRPLF